MDEGSSAKLLGSMIIMTGITLSTQGISNNQTFCHVTNLGFLDKYLKMDIAESFAAQGLTHTNVHRDALAGTVASGGFPAASR